MAMKIKNAYILREFTGNILFAFAIFAFMFSLRALLKIFEVFIQGAFAPLSILALFLLTFVTTLAYIIPLTFLYSSQALFARLSADRELIIFSSTGTNPEKLMKSLLLFSLPATVFLLFFNLFLMPEAGYRQRKMLQTLRFKNPLSLIQEKNVTATIPEITLYIEKIHRDYRIENIAITRTKEGQTNFLNAESGRMEYNREKNILIFKLINGRLVSQLSESSISTLKFAHYTFSIPLPSHYRQNKIERGISEMHLSALLDKKGLAENIEVHKRIIFGITPLFFVLLGAGMGRKIKQKSRVLHIGTGGIAGILFFQLIVLGEMLAARTN